MGVSQIHRLEIMKDRNRIVPKCQPHGGTIEGKSEDDQHH